MFRYKTIIGRKLQAETLPNQKIEAKIGCNVLNRMMLRQRLSSPTWTRWSATFPAGFRIMSDTMFVSSI
jgi:hypothetical protein